MGLWLARILVEQRLTERAHKPVQCERCPVCGTQTSTELVRLGCLLAVFLPFELAAVMVQQLCGIAVSEDTIWNWVQATGKQAVEQLEMQLQQLEDALRAWGCDGVKMGLIIYCICGWLG